MAKDSLELKFALSQLEYAVGEAVRNFRIELRLSQAALSDLSGLDRSFLGLLERGRRGASIETVWRISHALGIKPSELIERIERLAGAPPHGLDEDEGN